MYNQFDDGHAKLPSASRHVVPVCILFAVLWAVACGGIGNFTSKVKSGEAVPGASNAPGSADFFPLRVGDSWKYRSTTADGKQSEFSMKVLREEKQDSNLLYVVETFSTQPIHDWYSKPAGWVLMHRQAYPNNTSLKAEYQPVKQFLKNPLAAGDSWQWKGKGMMDLNIEESNQVDGPDSVQVPAGKFEAMKVVTKVVQGGAPVTKTYWYANGVGMVKSMTDTGSVKSTTELLDYSFKK